MYLVCYYCVDWLVCCLLSSKNINSILTFIDRAQHIIMCAFACPRKKSTSNLGATQINYLQLTCKNVSTSRPPSLPNDNRPARALYNSSSLDNLHN